MGRTCSTELKAHLAETTTSISKLIKIKRGDGSIFAFTDHDVDIDYDNGDGDGSITYSASKGHIPTAAEATASLEIDNLAVEGAFVVGGLLRDELLQGYFNYAEVRYFIVNWKDLSMGHMYLQRGYFGKVTLEDNDFSVEFEGLAAKLQNQVGDVISLKCQAQLGDSRCGVDLTSASVEYPLYTYTSTGTVTSIITPLRKFRATIANAPAADGWFDDGDLTWTSGNNNNLSIDVRVHTHISSTTHEIEIDLPMIKSIEIDDTFSITAGCKKHHIDDCKDKFNNLINFRGQPHTPDRSIALEPKDYEGGIG